MGSNHPISGTDVTALHEVAWIHGSISAKLNTDPEIQVHWHDDHTVVMRQNMAVNYEAPFLYLMFGSRRAVLFDTGATADAAYFPLRDVVDELVEHWLATHPADGYELLVLHTHAHGDHIAADDQFADRPATEIVGAAKDVAWPWFGFTDELDRPVHVDLGDRVLEVLQSPGHHESAVTAYDPRTRWLLTGDSVYPGRLYVENASAFLETLDRLVAFAERRGVAEVLGCHIEMTRTAGVDYPVRTTFQPEEPALPMTVGQLRDIRRAALDVGSTLGRHVFADFILEIRGP